MSSRESKGDRMEGIKHRLVGWHCIFERAIFAIMAATITALVGHFLFGLHKESYGEIALLNGGLAFYTHTVSEPVLRLLEVIRPTSVPRPRVITRRHRETPVRPHHLKDRSLQ